MHVLERIGLIQLTEHCRRAFPDDGSGPYLDVFNETLDELSRDATGRNDGDDATSSGNKQASDAADPALANLQTAHLVLFLSLMILVGFLLTRAAMNRLNLRNTTMRKLYELDRNSGGEGRIVQANLILSKDDARSATRTCGCYRAPDGLYGIDDDDDTPNDAMASSSNEERSGDLCTCLWKVISTLFCQWCCGCWCQCFGMCATAQEQREIDTLVPKERLLMDYVTFQPFSEYVPSLEKLRQSRDVGVLSHWRAMSELATMLMKSIGCVLVALGIYALTDIDSHFTLKNMVVVLATLLQSFVLMYFVHWKWHRLDLSLDAVVKYFATGFLFSTSTALIVEMLVSAVVSLVTGVLGIIAVLFEISIGELDDETDPKDMLKILIKENLWLGVLFMFLNAFVVAATTEEICKYFGFWMMEHPDLLTPQEDGAVEEVEIGRSRRSLNSKGVATTIAMVITAVGFSCCENLKYVFSSADIETEIGTLIARSMFPVHALAAAIQSIGVCRRDLEGDKSVQLGRIILPAVILHGCFDFFLMVSPILSIVNHADDITTDDDVSKEAEARYNMYVEVCQRYGAINDDVWQPTEDGSDAAGQQMSQTDVIITTTAFGLSILSVVVGTIYYIVQSSRQTKRLHSLDMARAEGSTLGLVV